MNRSSDRVIGEDHLYKLLEMVSAWLRFAETKNAALVTLSSVTLAMILGFVAQQESIAPWDAALLTVAGTILMVGLLYAVWSFFPRQDPVEIAQNSTQTPEESDNLFYYGHLAKRSPEQLLDELGLEGTTTSGSARSRLDRDLASQIIINSRIAQRKFDHFQSAARLWVVGTITAMFAVIVTLV